jgi:hypothetical protein
MVSFNRWPNARIFLYTLKQQLPYGIKEGHLPMNFHCRRMDPLTPNVISWINKIAPHRIGCLARGLAAMFGVADSSHIFINLL